MMPRHNLPTVPPAFLVGFLVRTVRTYQAPMLTVKHGQGPDGRIPA